MAHYRDPKRRLTLKALGFQEDPFTTSADPRFLYLSPQHNEVLSSAQEVIENRRGLAVIQGGFGVGKSTLARRIEAVYREYPDDFQVAAIHTASYESEYAALLDVSLALNVERRKGITMQWREFEGFLVDQAENRRNVVVILDDAQLMAPSSLRFVHHLYNFDVSMKLAQVVLFGQPEVYRLFDAHPEVASRVAGWYRLNPLVLEETFELIRFRCEVAGRRPPLLTQSALLKVWESTSGIPREVVAVCSAIVDVLGDQGKTLADDTVADIAVGNYLAVRSS